MTYRDVAPFRGVYGSTWGYITPQPPYQVGTRVRLMTEFESSPEDLPTLTTGQGEVFLCTWPDCRFVVLAHGGSLEEMRDAIQDTEPLGCKPTVEHVTTVTCEVRARYRRCKLLRGLVFRFPKGLLQDVALKYPRVLTDHADLWRVLMPGFRHAAGIRIVNEQIALVYIPA